MMWGDGDMVEKNCSSKLQQKSGSAYKLWQFTKIVRSEENGNEADWFLCLIVVDRVSALHWQGVPSSRSASPRRHRRTVRLGIVSSCWMDVGWVALGSFIVPVEASPALLGQLLSLALSFVGHGGRGRTGIRAVNNVLCSHVHLHNKQGDSVTYS